jgi:hypothetical protein
MPLLFCRHKKSPQRWGLRAHGGRGASEEIAHLLLGNAQRLGGFEQVVEKLQKEGILAYRQQAGGAGVLRLSHPLKYQPFPGQPPASSRKTGAPTA